MPVRAGPLQAVGAGGAGVAGSLMREVNEMVGRFRFSLATLCGVVAVVAVAFACFQYGPIAYVVLLAVAAFALADVKSEK